MHTNPKCQQQALKLPFAAERGEAASRWPNNFFKTKSESMTLIIVFKQCKPSVPPEEASIEQLKQECRGLGCLSTVVEWVYTLAVGGSCHPYGLTSWG